MANHKSALKRIRSNERKRVRNRMQRSRARTHVKAAREEIERGDAQSAREATLSAIKALDKAASKGIIHRNQAARKKSRLMKQLNALSQ